MSRKSKGINAERSLIHTFWANNWCAVRVAGSGSSKYPSPDILAGNILRKLAIECKTSKAPSKYFTLKEIEELKEFGRLFGAEPWVAVKFDRTDWYFITLDDMDITKNSYLVTKKLAQNKGLIFEELIT